MECQTSFTSGSDKSPWIGICPGQDVKGTRKLLRNSPAARRGHAGAARQAEHAFRKREEAVRVRPPALARTLANVDEDRNNRAQHVRADDLTPAELALLDRNQAAANEKLNELIRLYREHHADGACTNWYCNDPNFSATVDGLELHQAAQILGVAIVRITREP